MDLHKETFDPLVGTAFQASQPSVGSVSLNLAEIMVSKAATEESPFGFNLTYGLGPTADAVNGPDPGTTADNFFQYYLSGNMGGVTLDFGKFVTIAGAEVIETAPNWNYSRSFLFGLAIPFYHFGLRATIPVSDTFTLTGLLVNGWDNVVDNNGGKTFGVALNWKPSERFGIIQNIITGPETTGDNDTFRNLFDTIVTVGLSDFATFMVNFDYGSDQAFSIEGEGTDVNWVGVAAYLKLQAGMFSLTPRFEYFDDADGFRTGTVQKMKSFTLTPEIMFNDNLLTRFEYRHDWSTAASFSVGDAMIERARANGEKGLNGCPQVASEGI
jgi:hypothetical protein